VTTDTRRDQRRQAALAESTDVLRHAKRSLAQVEGVIRQEKRKYRKPAPKRNLGIGEVRKVYRERIRGHESTPLDQYIEDHIGEDWKDLDCDDRAHRMGLTLEERLRHGLRLHHATDVSRAKERKVYADRAKTKNSNLQKRKRQRKREASMITGLSDRRESVFDMVRVLGRADIETLAKAASNNPDWSIAGQWAALDSMRRMILRLALSLVEDGYLECETVKSRGYPRRIFSVLRKADKRTSGQSESRQYRNVDKPDTSSKRTTAVTTVKTESPQESYHIHAVTRRSTVH
jgi:hypothetical protein